MIGDLKNLQHLIRTQLERCGGEQEGATDVWGDEFTEVAKSIRIREWTVFPMVRLVNDKEWKIFLDASED